MNLGWRRLAARTPWPPDHDAFLERRTVRLEEALQMAREGRGTDALSKVARLPDAVSSPR
jgi:hypothetical protein